jgi:hypothetical protein
LLTLAQDRPRLGDRIARTLAITGASRVAELLVGAFELRGIFRAEEVDRLYALDALAGGALASRLRFALVLVEKVVEARIGPFGFARASLVAGRAAAGFTRATPGGAPLPRSRLAAPGSRLAASGPASSGAAGSAEVPRAAPESSTAVAAAFAGATAPLAATEAAAPGVTPASVAGTEAAAPGAASAKTAAPGAASASIAGAKTAASGASSTAIASAASAAAETSAAAAVACAAPGAGTLAAVAARAGLVAGAAVTHRFAPARRDPTALPRRVATR